MISCFPKKAAIVHNNEGTNAQWSQNDNQYRGTLSWCSIQLGVKVIHVDLFCAYIRAGNVWPGWHPVEWDIGMGHQRYSIHALRSRHLRHLLFCALLLYPNQSFFGKSIPRKSWPFHQLVGRGSGCSYRRNGEIKWKNTYFPQRTVVWAWEKMVVIWRQPGHLTSKK